MDILADDADSWTLGPEQETDESMDVFDLDEKLLYDYRRFARSFTQIRAKDIREGVDAIYRTNRF
jgi:hypothetical protein